MRDLRYVFLAGIGNSEPEHWQRRWVRVFPQALWVEHDDWEHVARDAWVSELDAALSPRCGPTVIIAHSLGCLLAAEWLREHPRSGVAGAFLVAPPDVDAPCFPASVAGFRARGGALPVPSMVIASRNDPYASIEYARRVSEHWGALLVDVGDKGHINLASRLGDWSEGQTLVARFVEYAQAGKNANED